jgi:uncharacterized protein YecA (UPF0149 family)
MDIQTGIIYTDQQRNKIIKRVNKIIETKAPEIPVLKPPRVGRNELCPCGSGKKYKKCHLWEDQGYK